MKKKLPKLGTDKAASPLYRREYKSYNPHPSFLVCSQIPAFADKR